MIKKCLFFLALVISSLSAAAGNDDPVVMTVAGHDIPQSEFQYFLDRNLEGGIDGMKTLLEYANLYVDFKMKVQSAMDAGIDTTEAFLAEYREYRGMQAQQYILDSTFLESVAQGSYEESVNEIGPDGLIYLYILSVAPENESEAEFRRCVALVDSIHTVLSAGGSFNEMARKYSNDPYASKGGEVSWMSRPQLPDDIGGMAFSLENGTFSKPFVSEGVPMIVGVMGRRDLGSYEENRDGIYQWMQEQPSIMDEAQRRKAMEYAGIYGWDVTDRDSAVMLMDSRLEEIIPEFGNISREYHDGLLMFEVSNREVWEKASNDQEAMEQFYYDNPKLFRFDEPRFKGMVFFCKEESIFHNIESVLKGLPIEEWADTIVTFNRGKSAVRVMRGSNETGIFKKGQNVYVDKLVFGEGDFKLMAGYPYANVIGKKLNAPESIRDIAPELSEKYQDYLEGEWLKRLHGQYKYKIYKKALKRLVPKK